MFLIALFVYFTMQQYFYRSSHRERFSSLQFGKVCPGRGLCDADLEWVLLIFVALASHIRAFLLLPMFTLFFQGGSGKNSIKELELKIIKKVKKHENEKTL